MVSAVARLVIAIVFQMVLMFPLSASGQDHNLVIATATPGGVYHPVGVGVASLLSIKLARDHGITATALNTSGSVENVRMLDSGLADLAIVQALVSLDAVNGREPFADGPVDGLMAIAMLWENVEHFVLRREFVSSGDLSDLSGLGQPFSMGSEGSGSEHSAQVILQSLGIVPGQDFTVVHSPSYKSAAQAFVDREIAGVNLPGGVPLGAVVKVFASSREDAPVILAVTPEQAATIHELHPIWTGHVIHAGTYPGQARDIQTIAQPNFLACRADMDEETAYLITRTLFENLAFLNTIHQATQNLSLDKATANLPIPLHPGAARYFREKGVLSE